jgi:hypothetical protein
MSDKVIWLPDTSQSTTVEWYVSDKKAVGVEGVRDEWRAVPVTRKVETGFVPPRDAR